MQFFKIPCFTEDALYSFKHKTFTKPVYSVTQCKCMDIWSWVYSLVLEDAYLFKELPLSTYKGNRNTQVCELSYVQRGALSAPLLFYSLVLLLHSCPLADKIQYTQPRSLKPFLDRY